MNLKPQANPQAAQAPASSLNKFNKYLILTALVPPLGLIVGYYYFQKRSNTSKRLPLILIALALILASAYAVLWHQLENKSNYKYTYKQLKPVNYGSTGKGQGLQVSLPAQFSLSKKNHNYETYSQSVRGVPIAVSTMDIIPLTAQQVMQGQSSLTILLTKGSPNYQNEINGLAGLISSNFLPANYRATITKVAKVDSLGTHFWELDFSARAPSKPSFEGKMLYGYGKNAVYTLVLATVSQNWSDQSAIWQKVVGSLQIDQ